MRMYVCEKKNGTIVYFSVKCFEAVSITLQSQAMNKSTDTRGFKLA